MNNLSAHDAKSEIGRMVKRIAELFRPEKIILFGSYASGNPGPDSDVDLLIVLPIHGSHRKKAIEIDAAISDRKLPVDLIVVTPEELQQGCEQIGTILRPALKEGLVLYERAA
jgi:predicted nucleotidyltransferase